MQEFTKAEPSHDFLAMWNAAGNHIQSFFQDGLQSWLKVDPRPPFLEHLSFRLGNQVFFLRVEDIDEHTEVPGNREGLLSVAEGWNGYTSDWEAQIRMPNERNYGASCNPSLTRQGRHEGSFSLLNFSLDLRT
ncbi:MAG: hypothetical protein U0975_11540 [Erythrobacter sp.]|nr:hypothetical protein [Erythrobacter sp.]MDZ4273296.1 hypothetical protein [Erythrobacter sp.]